MDRSRKDDIGFNCKKRKCKDSNGSWQMTPKKFQIRKEKNHSKETREDLLGYAGLTEQHKCLSNKKGT